MNSSDDREGKKGIHKHILFTENLDFKEWISNHAHVHIPDFNIPLRSFGPNRSLVVNGQQLWRLSPLVRHP